MLFYLEFEKQYLLSCMQNGQSSEVEKGKNNSRGNILVKYK